MSSCSTDDLTWVPNELEGAKLILFEFLDLLMVRFNTLPHLSLHIYSHTLSSLSLPLCIRFVTYWRKLTSAARECQLKLGY